MDLRKIVRLEVLLVFVPIAVWLHWQGGAELWVFVTSCLGIIPLAGLMGMATEQLAHRVGPTVGGLMNATFGNAAELIIALAALRQGEYEIVKASITGSVIGNILLVLGASQLLGGIRFERQVFNRTSAAMSATLMTLSAIGLVVPAILHGLFAQPAAEMALAADDEHSLNLLIAVVLFVSYLLSLLFTLVTHRHLFVLAPVAAEAAATEAYASVEPREAERRWSVRAATLVLLVATAAVVVLAEQLVKTVESVETDLGLSEIFIGVIVVAVIGNAAEHSSAVLVAWKNQMDLSFQIAVGSALQIALFVAPILVFASYVLGPEPMDLYFSTFEVIAVALSVLIVTMVAQDGESNWLEGALLLAVYVILGIAFFYMPHGAVG
jgi:Ca2+:H+ antiporter